jgi:5-methylcytosine-specific restriction endonuclease McrBC regulatory subunit McrC
MPSGSSEWVAAAVEAMTWVAEERGLGGSRSLDGLAWDISINAVWEAWVASFSADLGRHIGMVASPFQAARRFLRWEGPVRSMGALIPDVELRGNNRVVWLDAKYKRHLDLLARRGWQGVSDEVRAEHRADLHQALAYSSLADVPQVDTLLVYPGDEYNHRSHTTVATVTSGRRRVRLILASVPFGFRNLEHQEQCLRSFRELLAA